MKMNILRNIEVPTGNIMIVEGEKGKLEVCNSSVGIKSTIFTKM